MTLLQECAYTTLIRKLKSKNINQIVFNNLKKNYISQDMIAITTYFNPSKYISKKRNFIIFRDNLRKQGIPLMVVECSFDNSVYELEEEDADIVIRVSSQSRIWQKEKLLNIALEHIPGSYKKFCSLDCDIIFQNNSWVTETSKLLEKYPVTQPFEYAYRLQREEEIAIPKLYKIGRGNGKMIHGFAKGMMENKFQKELGHTGFAWAFRRDSFNYFYDKMIIGSGDVITAHALYGQVPSNKLDISKELSEDLSKYTECTYRRVRGKVGFTNGSILHLWHGSKSRRNYVNRHDVLREISFDPNRDLSLNKYGCWEVHEELNIKISKYFDQRKEDGE